MRSDPLSGLENSMWGYSIPRGEWHPRKGGICTWNPCVVSDHEFNYFIVSKPLKMQWFTSRPKKKLPHSDIVTC